MSLDGSHCLQAFVAKALITAVAHKPVTWGPEPPNKGPKCQNPVGHRYIGQDRFSHEGLGTKGDKWTEIPFEGISLSCYSQCQWCSSDILHTDSYSNLSKLFFPPNFWQLSRFHDEESMSIQGMQMVLQLSFPSSLRPCRISGCIILRGRPHGPWYQERLFRPVTSTTAVIMAGRL